MKVVQGFFLVVLAVILSVASLLGASALKWAQELPDPSILDELEFTSTSQIFASNGQLIGELVPLGRDGATTDRIPVSLDEVSPAALAAIIASEDDQFFRHYGFNLRALLYATYRELSGQGGRGGSTITVQLIKNVFFGNIAEERTLERKAKELMLALEVERRLTKAEILQRYINEVSWGGNLRGIRAAARAYFDKEPSALNLAEGLYLARLIPLPSRNYNDFVATRRSMRVVLDTMVARGWISPTEAERAWRYPLEPRGWKVAYDGEGNIVGEPERTGETIRLARSVSYDDLAPHAIWAVRNQLIERYGANVVFGAGGLRVYTTIDVQAQEAANLASLSADIPPGAQLAIVGLNPETGEIVALVGERLLPGRAVGELNRAVDSRRQPGSSFKPIVYATAIEAGGLTQAHTIVDEETEFHVPDQRTPWVPVNFDRTFHGSWTLRKHLNESYNIPAIKLLELVTPEAVRSRALELGYPNVRATLSMALGTYEASPLQHASAFSAFANGGVRVEPYLISRVEDASGNVLWQAPKRESRVWTEETAYIMLDMMHATVIEGIGKQAQVPGRWVGGKTGTSQNDRDLWFVGMTPGLVAAVWIGNDDDTPLRRFDHRIISSSFFPTVVWKNFVENALRGTPAREFRVPEGIVFHAIDLQTGVEDPDGSRTAFLSGTEPNAVGAGSQIRIAVPVDRRDDSRATEDTPREYIVWREIDPTEIDRYQ